MLRKFLHSVALVVFVSAPSFADIIQNQGFAVGMNSVIDLLGPLATASDSKFLTVNLEQAVAQGSGLLAVQSSPFGQATQPATNSVSLIATSFGSVTGGVQFPTSVIAPLRGGQLSLLDSLLLGVAIRP